MSTMVRMEIKRGSKKSQEELGRDIGRNSIVSLLLEFWFLFFVLLLNTMSEI